ncbi:MAG: shikimate dehydrogenase [Firmicutes bacterium]|nr:shikimate dehydrogenase [Bacillota bacterium]
MQDLDARTRIVGLLGWPVGHSVSPPMQNAAFKALGLNYRYVAFPVPPSRIGEATIGLRALSLAGANVTIPHKESIVPYLDELTSEAQAIGAVNTVVRDGNRLIGHNTDGRGFLLSLRAASGFDPLGKTAVLIGAGGSARAVGAALVNAGAARVIITNRTPGRAELLADVLKAMGPPVVPSGFTPSPAPGPAAEVWTVPFEPHAVAEAVARADLVVNCTPAGLRREEDVSRVQMVPRTGEGGLLALLPDLEFRSVACDLIFNPPATPFLARAAQGGALAVGGLGMLVYQGALAFKLWTGLEPPLEVMSAAARRALAQDVAPSGLESSWAGAITGITGGALPPSARTADGAFFPGAAPRRVSPRGISTRNLVLTGFMGSGKTLIGKLVADRLGLPFVDTDIEVERTAGIEIPEIFASAGEPGFRDLEAKVIAGLTTRRGQVIATGGGALLREQNAFLLRAGGLLVTLMVDPATVLERVKLDGKRPLLAVPNPEARIRELLAEREPVYRLNADMIVDTRDRTPEDIATEVAGWAAARLW